MKKIGIVLGALLALAGCKPEPSEEGDPFIPIGLTAGLEAGTKALKPGPIEGNNFPANTTDVFRLTVYASNSGIPTAFGSVYDEIENAQVNSTADLGRFSLQEGPKYYPGTGEALYFYAYSPYGDYAEYNSGTAAVPPSVTYTFDGTQDILWDTVTRGIRKAAFIGGQENPDFNFQHKLMLVEFTAMASENFHPNGLEVREIWVKDVNTQVELDLVSGRMQYGARGEIGNAFVTSKDGKRVQVQEYTENQESLESFCPLMFEPQATFVIEVVLSDGTTYSDVPVSLSGSANPGASFRVNLTINRSEIVATGTVVPWDPQGDTDVTLD